MLNALSVRNIVLIDQLDLTLEDGLTALTGETGAGRSILLDALTLALGGRGDASLVRAGAESGQVVAVLQLPRPSSSRLRLTSKKRCSASPKPIWRLVWSPRRKPLRRCSATTIRRANGTSRRSICSPSRASRRR